MFRKGDKFIRFSPYGGVTRGIVASVSRVLVTDVENKIKYWKYTIYTDHNNYDAEECRKLYCDLDDEQVSDELEKIARIAKFRQNNFGKIKTLSKNIKIKTKKKK